MKSSNNQQPVYLKNLLLTAVCSLGLLFVSCGDNSTGTNGGTGNGNGNGDGGNGGTPSEPTFSNVQNILSSSCATSGCHDSSTEQNGVNLTSYDDVMNSVGQQYGENVVQADDAAGSPLVDKIESGNPEFGDRMPPGGPYLSTDDIDLIKDWINEGAEDN